MKKFLFILVCVTLSASIALYMFQASQITELQNVNFDLQQQPDTYKVADTYEVADTYKVMMEKKTDKDRAIYLRDPNNFIADGVIILANNVTSEEYIVVKDDGREVNGYLYTLDSVPRIIVKGDTEITRIKAVEGETVHLMTSSYMGVKRLSYYTCYTNSAPCTIKMIETSIIIKTE